MEKGKIEDGFFPDKYPECPKYQIREKLKLELPQEKCGRCVLEESALENSKKNIETDSLKTEGIEIIECPECKVRTGIDCGGPQKLEQWKCKNCNTDFGIEYLIDPETEKEVICLGPPSPKKPEKYPLFPEFEKEQKKQE